MSKATSKDGTLIAYEKNGQGPALILVDGALCYRSFGPMAELSKLLAPHFTVYTYDRRGRGESSNGMPFAVKREVEDIEALIDAAGGKANLFGISSGGRLALEAAVQLGNKIQKLAIYEAPYNSDMASIKEWKDYRKNLAEALSANRRGEAVMLFMKLVGTPAEMVEGMRNSPAWPMFEAVAPTLDYDAADMGEDRSVPGKRMTGILSPTLVLNGTALPFMLDTAQALAKAIPHAQQRTLEGQRHDVDLKVLAPVLVEFFDK